MDQDKVINKPKVSVIIPVYNTEAYAEEAIRSIMCQTLSDIEIIIINDGSTDNSQLIIEKLTKEDQRISFYQQENKGQSEARNYGIIKAIGEYLYFMDSDDLLDEKTLELCYEKCETGKLDFVFFDAAVFYTEYSKQLPFDYKKTELLKNGIYSGLELLERMIDKKVYSASVCLNLIGHNYIKNNKLKFYPGIIHEDELFSYQLYKSAQRVSFINQKFYKRRVRENSTMTQVFSLKNITGYFTVLDYLQSNCIGSNSIVITTQKLIEYIINPVIYNASVLSAKHRWKLFFTCIRKKYIPYIRIKNLCVLLFPWLIQIKALVKRKDV